MSLTGANRINNNPKLIPAIRRERGFLPLGPETVAAYREFWANNSSNLKRLVQEGQTEYNLWPRERSYNGWFECGDAELYYAMIRHFKPNLIIEVGSGFSTHLALEAVKVNGKGRIISIDPMPRTDLPAEVTYIQDYVQNIDLALFEQLGENDLLFIDSSHEAEEALYHYLILDRLAAGVVVHHHDFVFPLPLDYPDQEFVIGYLENGEAILGQASQMECPEENVIISYYVNRREHWEGLVSNALARQEMGPEGYSQIFPLYRLIDRRIPGSIYTRKRAGAPDKDKQELAKHYEEVSRYADHVTTEYNRAVSRLRELEQLLGKPARVARLLVGQLRDGALRRLFPRHR